MNSTLGGIILKCPKCLAHFELETRHIAAVTPKFHEEEARYEREQKRLLRSRPKGALKAQVKNLILRAADSRTPIHERVTAVRIIEKKLREHKLSLGQGLDAEILRFQFLRGWLAGFEQAERPRLEA